MDNKTTGTYCIVEYLHYTNNDTNVTIHGYQPSYMLAADYCKHQIRGKTNINRLHFHEFVSSSVNEGLGLHLNTSNNGSK
jgi:hypothetical protein